MKPRYSLFIKSQALFILAALFLFSCRSVVVKKPETTSVPQHPPEAAAPVNEIPPSTLKFENASVTPTTNIHFTGKYCNECHEKTPVKGGDWYLKFNGNYDQLCRCHTDKPAPFLHPTKIIPSPAKKRRMPADFPLQNGELTCDTCHDIYLLCQKSLFPKSTLRGGPYATRTAFCFNCHEKKNYTRLNPHDQLNADGEIIIEKCLFCHKVKPDERHATFKEVKFIGDIEELCLRCHQIADNHPGDAVHMGVAPSAEYLKRMKAIEEKYHLILPLTEDGKMTCITCHNPHEKGVIPGDRPGATGAGSKNRLRLAVTLCKECHQM